RMNVRAGDRIPRPCLVVVHPRTSHRPGRTGLPTPRPLQPKTYAASTMTVSAPRPATCWAPRPGLTRRNRPTRPAHDLGPRFRRLPQLQIGHIGEMIPFCLIAPTNGSPRPAYRDGLQRRVTEASPLEFLGHRQRHVHRGASSAPASNHRPGPHSVAVHGVLEEGAAWLILPISPASKPESTQPAPNARLGRSRSKLRIGADLLSTNRSGVACRALDPP
ncbi:MAG: hypothetical protein QOC76_4035, partial [Mycobacterium sp.]|nr:hypothetical protein [Mycobacterium sp.]